MTTPTTPRTINADVFRRARRAGLPLNTAAYVARPAVIDLDWLSHYQVDGEWTNIDHNGRRFRVTVVDAAAIDGQCDSCAELVDAYRAKDENIAWMTPDEYDATDHRGVTVTLLDDHDDETAHEASLWGVCGPRNTEMERLLDDRYLAETVLDLAAEAAHDADQAGQRTDARRGELLAAARDVFDHKNEDAAKVLRDIWADAVPRSAKVAATYFALIGARGIPLSYFPGAHAGLMEDAEEITPGT